MNIQYESISKCGKRSNNEDAFNIIDTPEQHRWFGIVCDGLGGHPHGDIASKAICEVISNYWSEHVNQHDDKQKVVTACKYAQRFLDDKTDEFNHVEMGTTMVMASIHDDLVTIAWLGDSRAYYTIAGDDLFYRTKDDVKLIYDRIVVSRCFFSYHEDWSKVSVVQLPLKEGARLVLCSDGVYNAMEIAAPALLWKGGLEKKTPERLIKIVDQTCAKYGDDNYTANFAMAE